LRRKKAALLFLLLSVPVFLLPAQANTPANPDAINWPQWAKDLRRGEIIAFGSFPFAMFVSSFLLDMHRWRMANGLDFSNEGRRYAPWPLKSTGGQTGSYGMTSDEAGQIIALAAGIAVGVAVADHIIIRVKRNRERRRIEVLPAGTVTINQSPWGMEDESPEEPDDDDNADDTAP